MSDETRPNRWQMERPYVHLDLDQLKGGIKSVLLHRNAYFTKALDSATWTLTSLDGMNSDEVPLEDADTIIDRCGIGVIGVTLKLYHREETRNLGLMLVPEQYVALSVDFGRRRFRCEIATVGQANAEAIFRLLTTGLGLLSVELPREHAYLEAYLLKFAEDHADAGKNVFLIMRFQPQPPFPLIVSTIRDACAARGLQVLRADDREYTDDIWDNVMTYMYACSSAIAVFDEINYREFNPNVALEVGFMLAQRKPVLLLKDTAILALPTDIVGKSYRPFNTYDPTGTIPPQIGKWIVDYRIGT